MNHFRVCLSTLRLPRSAFRVLRFAFRVSRSAFVIPFLLFALACHEEGDIRVADLKFEGVTAVDASRLRSVLATRKSSRLPWGQKRYFNRQEFEQDLQRVVAFYVDRGYPDAKIGSVDVRFNDKRDQVNVTIVVVEGEPIRVADIRFVGFEAVPDDHFEAMRARVPIQPGAPRDRDHINVTREVASSELRDHGYPYAKVDAIEEKGGVGVTVTFRADPGPIAYFGPIQITGNASVGDQVIRRQLLYRPGELFRVSRLEESQRKLYNLELFEFVNIETVGTEQRTAEVPTRITVTEGKHRRVTLGVGYGTEEKARVDAKLQHVNFLGGARTAGIQGKWSSLDRGARLTFNEPYFFAPRLSFDANGQHWFADEPAFQLQTIGGRATVTHRAVHRQPQARSGATQSVSASYIHEFEDYSIRREALADLALRDDLIALGLDPRTGRGRGTLSALAFDAQRSTVANLLNATQGYVLSGHVEQAGKWLPGDFSYWEFTSEGRHYWTVVGRAVFANRIRVGTIDGAPTAVTPTEPGRARGGVPFFKRYFLGGSTSLRGWGRFEVSPLSGAGLPLGGHSMLEMTSELRVPIFGKLGGVVFIDAGNVWADSWRIRPGDLRLAVGPGIRYLTPIGPVRFDFGYQLTPIDGLLIDGKPEPRRWRVHFSIGQAF